MEPTSWRKLQEGTTDMTKSLWGYYSELIRSGFRKKEAFELTKIFSHMIFKMPKID
ncbi:unnamed protein product [marine sediment metagenome]|uniref:Uncharacterized protein n=1 Tax=marine sediment metagenome TaxID=412755 RepID=X1JJD5_9ZZZZ